MGFLQGLSQGVNVGNARDSRLQNQQITDARVASSQAKTAATDEQSKTKRAREDAETLTNYLFSIDPAQRSPQLARGFLTGVRGRSNEEVDSIEQQGLYGDFSDQHLKAIQAAFRGEQVLKSNEVVLGAGGTPIYENRPNINLAAGGKAITGTGEVLADNPVAPKPQSQPTGVQEYNFAKQNGFKGSFIDFKNATKSKGVTVNTGDRGSVGQNAVDKAYASDYLAWTQGGGSDNAKLVYQLDDALEALESGRNLTGPVLGITPDVFKAWSNPESIAVRERIAEVVQRNLRVILGAQFTEKEGKMLIDRAFNPKLGEAENARRVRALITQIKLAAESKESAARYFEDNGTLRGWTGKTFNLIDFEDAVSSRAIQASRDEIAAEMAKRGLPTGG